MAEPTLDPQATLQYLIDAAKRHGATAADALLAESGSTEVRVRLGETEHVQQSRSKGVGLRVFFGERSATTSSSDLSKDTLDTLVAQTCAAAKVLASDPAAGLPDAALFEGELKAGLDLHDPRLDELTPEAAIAMAREAEDAARAADPRIANSEGAEMSWGGGETHLANSHGVYRHATQTSAGLWTSPIAKADDGGMERDHWYTSARHREDLESPAAVGRIAAERTLRRLGARKPATCRVPVIFEWTIASRMLSALGSAVNGGSIYRNTSYLCDKLGERIAAPSVTINDDALIPRGPGSRHFDGEGLATRRTTVVREGVLESYLLDTYTARKLGMESTRSARRGLGGTPSPGAANFWMEPGDKTLAELIAEVERGILVTEVIGFGINQVTGDYSQGAAGIWIEKGELAYPVSELTIASTLPEMWAGIDGIADDRDPARSVSAPSFRIAAMTVAGT